MENGIARAVIETFVKKALHDIRDDPERSARNLVDKALSFSRGRFQANFFRTAQHMLHNERSPYYTLVRDAANHVAHDRLLGFGLNIGYNSCTAGAKKIREIEAKEGFNIPWALFVGIDAPCFQREQDRYARLIDEGRELGVYTWLIRAESCPLELMQLMERNDDCAFVLLCGSEQIGPAFIEEAERLNNLLIGIEAGEQAEELCGALRDARLLYCLYLPYSDDENKDALRDDFLYDAQALGALFAVFLPKETCSREAQAQTFDYVRRMRAQPRFSVIPWELFQDSLAVDTIISEDGCSAGFHADGAFFTLAGRGSRPHMTLWDHPLRDILRVCLAK